MPHANSNSNTATTTSTRVPLTAEILFGGVESLSVMGAGSQFHFKADVTKALLATTTSITAAAQITSVVLADSRQTRQRRNRHARGTDSVEIVATLMFAGDVSSAMLTGIVLDANNAIRQGTFPPIQVSVKMNATPQMVTATASVMRSISKSDDGATTTSADPASDSSKEGKNDDSSTDIVVIVVLVLVFSIAVVGVVVVVRMKYAQQQPAPAQPMMPANQSSYAKNSYDNPTYQNDAKQQPGTSPRQPVLSLQAEQQQGQGNSEC